MKHMREVLEAVIAERHRQDDNYGDQSDLPDGTGGEEAVAMADVARDNCGLAVATGQLSWHDILNEEFREAMAETIPARLREELIQVAAVAIAWAEALDSRAARRAR